MKTNKYKTISNLREAIAHNLQKLPCDILILKGNEGKVMNHNDLEDRVGNLAKLRAWIRTQEE